MEAVQTFTIQLKDTPLQRLGFYDLFERAMQNVEWDIPIALEGLSFTRGNQDKISDEYKALYKAIPRPEVPVFIFRLDYIEKTLTIRFFEAQPQLGQMILNLLTP